VKATATGLSHLFPRPEQLAEADLSIVGIRGACAKAVRSLARAVLKKELTFERSKTMEDTLSRLSVIRGLGERECHNIAMRVFGEPDRISVLRLRAQTGR
jgi:AraC family transcriptional regulator of adaptative response / DNA-3-methyladenine glycosylase II